MELQTGDSIFQTTEQGGMLRLWEYKGKEVISHFHNDKEGNRNGGIFACVPFFGPSPDGMDSIPQHGWPRIQRMDQIEYAQGKQSHGKAFAARVVYRGRNTENEQYPWQLMYKIAYTFLEKELRVYVEVFREPDGSETLAPVTVALHPFFAVTSEEAVFPQNSLDRAITFSKEAYLVEGSKLPWFVNTPAGRIKVQFQGCQSICLWSRDPKKHACIEPILSPPEFFGTDAGHYLASRESVSISMTIEIL